MPRYLFVTGKLAAQSLISVLSGMPSDFSKEVSVLPISVAAFMDTRFVAKHVADIKGCDTIIIPGSCHGELSLITDQFGAKVIRGPKSLKDIPAQFGAVRNLRGYGDHKVKIFAEIVDAYQISLDQVLERASYFKSNGADIIDLGCPVNGDFPNIGRVVQALKERGFLVSIDSFNTGDILQADKAGVDYLLSVNSANLELARRLRCKVVVIPDSGQGLESLERNIAQFDAWRIPCIIDPILNPIGFGFTESIAGFIAIRKKHPQAEILMGLGNLTELTDADTTGMTAVMAGIITELGINYVLTTEVIQWARGAVRELDLARRLMYYACQNKTLPKHLNDGLITIKDPPFQPYEEDELRAMHAKVRDRHFRIFASRDSIYVFNNKVFIKGIDIQAIFKQLPVEDASLAFYLGKEMEKAQLAIRLGKKYTQEEDLRWGYLSSW